MSLQALAAVALAGAAALWFLRDIFQAFRPEAGCASGCGGCAKRCPFPAPSPQGGTRER